MMGRMFGMALRRGTATRASFWAQSRSEATLVGRGCGGVVRRQSCPEGHPQAGWRAMPAIRTDQLLLRDW